jgi:IS30 family transposase
MSGYKHLQSDERDRIAEMRAQGLGPTAIGEALGRSKSTISRELKRNVLDSGSYRPVSAEGSYRLRRQRPARLDRDFKLRNYVELRLIEGWTPEQISGRLRTGMDRLAPLSHEAIYAWIYSASQKL